MSLDCSTYHEEHIMKIHFRVLAVTVLAFCTVNPAIAQWTQTSGLTADTVNAIAAAPNGSNGIDLFAATDGGIYLSTNSGTNWTAVDSGLVNIHINALAVVPNGHGGATVFAGTNGSGVYRTTDYGSGWMAVNNGDLVDGTYIFSFGFMSNGLGGGWLFAGADNSDVFLSTNNGGTWKSVNTGLKGTYVLSLATLGNYLYAGTALQGPFESTSFVLADTLSWTSIGSSLPIGAHQVSALAVSGVYIFAVIGGGVYRYLSPGWTEAYKGLPFGIDAINVYFGGAGNPRLFAGGPEGGVYLSTDDGDSWAAVDTGLAKSTVQCLSNSGNYLFAGTVGSGVWRRPMSELLTSVKGSPSDVPAEFSLSQNYPNPFNPTTTIAYDLPRSGQVTMKVYNILGQEVVTLVNADQHAGSHLVKFNGDRLTSGVYYYVIQANGVTRTRKMILLK